MVALIQEGLQELRRPLAWRRRASRRGFAGLAVICMVPALALFLATGAYGVADAAPASAVQTGPEVLDRVQAFAASVPVLARWGIAALMIPVLFGMIRRSNDLRIPRILSILGVIVLVVSTLSVLFSLEDAVNFPATRTLWTMLTGEEDDMNTKIAIGVIFSFVFLFTLIFDILLMALIGLVALAAMAMSWAGALAVACWSPKPEAQP